MKNRILKNWTWTRGIYLIIGLWVISQGTVDGNYIGIVLGAWPAAMAFFGIGCASGSCEVPPEADR
ncbi:hypothetical protein ACW6QP_01225 [Salegentibacter sp. HM20]